MFNVAVIGAGAIARRAHLPTWRKIKDARILGVADIDEKLLARVAREFEIGATVKDYRRLLDDPAVDIVDICTPTPTHHQMVLDCLQAGKHVLVEKPLTLSLDGALEIYDQLARSDRKLSVLQNYRYIQAALDAKQRIQTGRIGRVLTAHGKSFNAVPVGWTRGSWLYHKAAVLYDFTPHLIDIILWLADDRPATVFAVGRDFTENAPFLASAQIVVEFENKAVAMMDTSWTTNASRFELDLFGDGGFLHVEPMRDYLIEGHASTTPLEDTRNFTRKMSNIVKGVVTGSLSNKQLLAYKPLFEQFIDCITEDTSPPVPVAQALNVNLVLEAAVQSISSKSPVHIPEMLEQHTSLEQAQVLKI